MCYNCSSGGGYSAGRAYSGSMHSGIDNLVSMQPVYNSIAAYRPSFSSSYSALEAALGQRTLDYSPEESYASKSLTYVRGVSQAVTTVLDQNNLVRGPAPVSEDSASSLRSLADRVFRLMTGKELPEDIILSVVSADELDRLHSAHGGAFSGEVMGFSVNRRQAQDINSVFAKRMRLDLLLLTLGHEIGHVLSMPAGDSVLEEAKAFAFEVAWMQTIYRFDIAGLKQNMNFSLFSPAHNGLHNVAFDFVKRLMQTGLSPGYIFDGISRGRINNVLDFSGMIRASHQWP